MTKKESSRWKNRIVGHGDADPATIKLNPKNWRTHSEVQAHTLDDVLDEVGWIQQVIVNKRTGNLIDGELRVKRAIAAKEKSMPVVFVDLSEEEEAKALATFDPLSAIAGSDQVMFESLTESMTVDGFYLRELLKSTGLSAGEDSEEEEAKALATFDPLSAIAGSDQVMFESLTESMTVDGLYLRELLKSTGLSAGEDSEEEVDESAVEQSSIEVPGMELQPFEHYDYIVMMFKNDQDFSHACEVLKIGRVACPIPNSDKVKIGLGRVVDGARVMKDLCK